MKSKKFRTAVKATIIVLLIYMGLMLLFYYLSGDQLKYRDSRSNYAMAASDIGSPELMQGTVIEQTFNSKIQRFKSVSLQFGTYLRDNNSGTVTVQVIDKGDHDKVLISQKYPVKDITEGQVITAEAPDYIELKWTTLAIRVTADSTKDHGVFLYMVQNNPDGASTSLTVNGAPNNGQLCFSANGQDYIWIGLVYWKLVAVGAVMLIVLCIIVAIRDSKGNSRIIGAVYALKKYRFLIKQLVSRDFKRKYKRSVLGIFWSLLNPLLMMAVQYFVFSTIFKANIPNYGMYLLIGIVTFNFFTEATTTASNSIVANASLIKKVYVPKYIYPFTSVLFTCVNFFISLIPLVVLGIITGVKVHKAMFLTPFFFICVIIFVMGISLILAALMVYFRDTQFIWGLVTMVWMYATPIFYPETIIPDNFKWVFTINPMYYMVTSLRMCILNGISPEPRMYLECLAMSLAVFILGSYIFIRKQDRFILYL